MSQISEYVWSLKAYISILEKQLEAFRNGNKYVTLRKDYEAICRELNQKIKKLEEELAQAHRVNVVMYDKWLEVFEDVKKEEEKKAAKLDAENKKLQERIFQVEKQRDDALNKVTEWRRKFYDQSAKMEELEGMNAKLTAQVNKDFQNSSVPSSQQGADRKRIPNSRKKAEGNEGDSRGTKGIALRR